MKKILAFFIFAAFCQMIPVPCLYAEVVLDGSTGAFGQLETQNRNYDIKMKYGHQAGENLFHSFSQFNVNTGESATFGVSESIRNIISRVTGGTGSFIDGTLRSVLSDSSQISAANLYLLNPAGIMFGPNAALDIGGSFHISTADYLRMGDADRFYSTVQENEMLSSAPPQAFGFLKSPAEIRFDGIGEAGDDFSYGLTAAPLQNISVTGGNISMTGTYSTSLKPLGNLSAPGGTVSLVSVNSPGEVILSESGPDVSSFSTLGTSTLSDHSLVKTSGPGSGNIFIRAGQFVLESDSVIEADTKGSENGGITDIQADTVSISAGDIFSDATGTGRGGDISISGIGGNAAKSVTISDGARVFANATNPNADAGDAGKVSVFSETLILSSGSEISSSAEGDGNGGNILLNASASVLLEDGSRVFASSSGTSEIPGKSGSGDILIESPEINLTGGSQISIDTANGAGGTLIIRGLDGKPAESVTVSDSQIYAGTLGSGNAGDVLMQAERIRFEEKGFIGSETFGSGTGGNIRIEAGDTFELADGAYISSNSKESATGNAGNISVWAGDSVYLRSSSITTETMGSGAGGNIRIEAGNTFELVDGSYISSNSEENAAGNAGNISVRAGDLIRMIGSSITTEALNAGGGKISLKAQNMIYATDSRVATSVAKGADDAGDISLDPLWEYLDFFIMNRSEVRANAYEGKGGNIRIETGQFISSGTSVVDASSQLGIDGTINIISPEADVSQGLVKLSSSMLDAAQWMQTPCFQRSGSDVSTFVFIGQDAVPNPRDDLQNRNPLFWEQTE